MSTRQTAWSRVLLTGGTGFVGRYLADALSQELPAARKTALLRAMHSRYLQDWSQAVANISDATAVDRAVADCLPDLILHLAAQSSVGNAHGAPEETWRVNFNGTQAIAAACSRNAPRSTFFYVSSAEVYGESFREGVATEDTRLSPGNPYSKSKAASELELAQTLRGTNRLIVVRPFNHTGRGQDERFVLPSFAAQIAAMEAGRAPPVLHVGGISAEREFLDVRDVCAAYLGLLAAAPGLPKLNEAGGNDNIFNVCSGQTRKISDVIEIFRAKSTVEFAVVVDASRLRPAEILVAKGSGVRISSLTGWAPTITLEETVETLLSHARTVLS